MPSGCALLSTKRSNDYAPHKRLCLPASYFRILLLELLPQLLFVGSRRLRNSGSLAGAVHTNLFGRYRNRRSDPRFGILPRPSGLAHVKPRRSHRRWRIDQRVVFWLSIEYRISFDQSFGSSLYSKPLIYSDIPVQDPHAPKQLLRSAVLFGNGSLSG